MGEKDFNPMFIDEKAIVLDGTGLASDGIIQRVGPGVNVMKDANDNEVAILDDNGNPIFGDPTA